MESRRDWAGLNPDLLVEIAVRVPLIEDFMAFRGVCSSWRVAGSKDKFRPMQPSVPLLMLPGKSNEDGNDVREFYSLSRRKVCMRLSLPETTRKRCSAVGFGWLMAFASWGEVSLLNPFSGARIELPDELMFHDKFNCIGAAALSADPSHTSSFVLMAAFVGRIRLGFWRLGDEVWNEIESSEAIPWLVDMVYYKEKFYAADYLASSIWIWDPFGHPNPAKAKIMLDIGVPSFRVPNLSLVESSKAGLLLITTHREDERPVVQIRKIDVMKPQWELVAGLGNDVVFVDGMTMSMPASVFPEFVEPNRIYFTTSGYNYSPGAIGYPGGDVQEHHGKNMGIYNLEDGSTEWLVVDEPLNRVCRPVWIAPSF